MVDVQHARRRRLLAVWVFPGPHGRTVQRDYTEKLTPASI
jgi:hypothetical protein